MAKINHSKYKNTGIIFEILVRQITSDTLSNKDSKAIDIVKSNFSKSSELLKEQKLYNILINSKSLTESKANILINSVLENVNKINKNLLKREKYNLIKEIKQYYNIEDFFKTKITNYNVLASIYTLFENQYSTDYMEPKQLVENKYTLLEHISKKEIVVENTNSDIDEFSNFDKGTRLLVYKKLLEKFNTKYSTLSVSQKELLKEYINNISNTNKLKEYINSHVFTVKKELIGLNETVKDETLKIKINEVISLIKPIQKNQTVKDDNVISLLQYYQLINEIKSI